MSDTIIVTQEMGIARLSFNRPAFFNAFDYDTIDHFANLLIALAIDNTVRGIVISGEGMARELAGGSLNSFGWSKQLLTDSFNNSFESQIEKERFGLCDCADNPDGKEGLKAFKEKRKPVFKTQ